VRVPLIASTLLHAAAVGLVTVAAGGLLPSPLPEWTLEVRLVGPEAGEAGSGAGSAREERGGGSAPPAAAPVATPAQEAPAAGTAEHASPTGEPAGPNEPGTRQTEPGAAAPVQGEQAARFDSSGSREGRAHREESESAESGLAPGGGDTGAAPLGSAGGASDGSEGAWRTGGAGLTSGSDVRQVLASGAGSPGPGAAGLTGNGSGQERGGYPLGAIAARLRSATRYPFDARARGVEGTVTVRFRLGPRGEVEGVDLLRASGDRALDNAALEAVRRGAPYPAQALTVEAPIVFDLDERPARR
jgi:TonB family protein